MPYKVIFSKTFLNEIKKLDPVVKKRLKKKLEEYLKNPIGRAKKLTNSLLGEYRWRIGNYRIIFDVKGTNVIILRVGHRKEVYR